MKKASFRNSRVLVTGGAGFLGSNLAIALVRAGARVSILDNFTPSQGGNLFNLKPVIKEVELDFSDIRDEAAVKKAVRGKDYIFHLARQTDHILSITNPFPDIDVNVRGTAVLLEACRYINPGVRLVYAGTRGQYGRAVKLPVSEDAPTHPKGIYEITNLTAEKLVGIYHDTHGVPAVMLRITNVYGPRSQMKHDHYGVVNWFMRLALEGKTIRVFGDGMLKRDFLYVDDAVEALLLTAKTEACYGEILNVGRNTAETFLDLVKQIIKGAGSGSWEFAPFTPERAVQDPGSFMSDIAKIKRLAGWKPTTALSDGIQKTLSYYRKYRTSYW